MTRVFPAHFSLDDKAKVLALFDAIREELRPYEGTWTAHWLVNKATDPEWKIITRSSRNVGGEWFGLRVFSWDLRLPNGSSLLDPPNERMLLSAQKAAFLARTLPGGGIGSSTTLIGFLYSLSTLIRWLYLHETIYRPASEAFRRLSASAVEEFLSLSSEGGVPWVLGYPQAFLDFCYKGAQCPQPGSNSFPLQVPDQHRLTVIGWLEEQGFYRPGVRDAGEMFLDRREIASALGFDLHTIKSHPRFGAFLRQFEPTVASEILVGREKRREFPSHRSSTVRDLLAASCAENPQMCLMLSSLLRLHRHLPEEIPDSSNIPFAKILRRFTGRKSSHTPWIPLDIALKYTTEALRWVHEYGEDLVDYVLLVVETLERYAEGEKIYSNPKKRDMIVRAIPVPASLGPLNISGVTSSLSVSVNAYDQFRSAPGLNDALGVLLGAIIQLVAITKPSRERELSLLPRNCVLFRSGDGYWMRSSLGKSGTQDYRLETEKPIPAIVAKALSLVKRLSDGLRKLRGDFEDDPSAPLFWLPDRDAVRMTECSQMTSVRACSYLDRFCDWVNLPPDEYGRRWYIRIHEMRKSFLITFFWCFRFGGLDAARWIAGHTNAADVYAYIEANFPGEELPAIEAQYAAEQLWAFESSRDDRGPENTPELYDVVRKAFQVGAIDLVPERDLIAWLTMQFREGQLDIEPYSIRDSESNTVTRICFRITGRDR